MERASVASTLARDGLSLGGVSRERTLGNLCAMSVTQATVLFLDAQLTAVRSQLLFLMETKELGNGREALKILQSSPYGATLIWQMYHLTQALTKANLENADELF